MALIELTKFATRRHFGASSSGHAGSKFPESVTPADVVSHLNVLAMDTELVPSTIPDMVDFCTHLIVPNWTDALTGVVAITDETRPLIVSDYVKRVGRDDEPSYLARWINESDLPESRPVASYIDVALYSREQLSKEGISIDADWGVVNIAMHMSAEESPMAPSTVTRNALGRELGGNGAAFCLVTNETGADYYRRFILVK